VKSVKSVSKTKPNWLLRALVGVSLGIHLVIFMHISGPYMSNTLTYIELTLQDISKPPARCIPRPYHRPKPLPQPQDIENLSVTHPILQFKPIKIEPVERDLLDSPVERISMPDMLDVPGLYITNWHPGKSVEEASDDYGTSEEYLETVRLKIEKYKKYPDTARIRQIEGRVTIQFVITPEGHVRSAEVVKTSRHKVLNAAALKAVQDADPFPKPPWRFFKGEVPLEITIVFELT